jgi:hypothetical protein
MSEQIWHAFYFDHAAAEAPCRSEVIEATNEEAAARVARDHLGLCERVSLEAASWTERKHRMIVSEKVKLHRSTIH